MWRERLTARIQEDNGSNDAQPIVQVLRRQRSPSLNMLPKETPVMNNAAWYSRFAKTASHFCGRPRTFAIAVAIIVVWIATGPMFHFSDTWQLVINTGTTIITFLMVFLIQNTQNRDTEAIQIKLDDLIRATQGAHNALLDLEELEEGQLDAFRTKYRALATAARAGLLDGLKDTDSPEL
jgi:low affinity Fe/Cu permease